MPRFYVTMTWDNFPEGGSFGTVVEADDHEQAEELCKREMAASRVDEIELDEQTPEEAEANIRDLYESEWHVVDCFNLDDFIRQHTPKDTEPTASVTFTADDLPRGPFGGDRDKAAEWLATNAGKVEDRLSERGNEVIGDLVAFDVADGKLREEPEDGSERDFWDSF